MKQIRILLTVFLCALVLCACGSEKDVAYVQRLLPAPESIAVLSGNGSTLTYEKTDEKYEKIYAALSENWWKTMEDGTLTDVTSLKSLKTTSDRTYLQSEDTIVQFLYPDTIAWTQDDGSTLNIQLVAFVMPQSVDADSPVEGYFTVAKETLGYNEGLFTYYYPPEIASSFWGFVIE